MSTSIEKVTSSLDKLKVSANAVNNPKSKKIEVADSWEDEADESSGAEVDVSHPVRSKTSNPSRIPPTMPVSPPSSEVSSAPYGLEQTFNYDDAVHSPSSRTSTGSSVAGLERRPEKSTAVAARLIAAGIGQRAPRRTQEERDYDRAMKIQEKKKRDDAKQAEEKRKRDKEQAQRDIWGD